MHWHNAHAHTDAERAIQPGSVRVGQPAQRAGKKRAALAGAGVVRVLDELIVEVSALYILPFTILDDKQLAVIRVGAIKHFPGKPAVFHRVRKLPAQTAVAEAGHEQPRHHQSGDRRLVAPPHHKVNRRQRNQDARSDQHGHGIWKMRDKHVANQHRARHAAEGADGGESAHVAAHFFNILREHAHEERAGHRQQRQRDEEQKCRCKK